MVLNLLLSSLTSLPIISKSNILSILIFIVAVFGFLLFLGVRKSYMLKKENERLESMTDFMDNQIDEDSPYRDFTEGHMYGGDH